MEQGRGSKWTNHHDQAGSRQNPFFINALKTPLLDCLRDSNTRPPHYECDALPTELRRHRCAGPYLCKAGPAVKRIAWLSRQFAGFSKVM